MGTENTVRTPSESKEHGELINMMVQYFIGQEARNIWADVPGMPSPDTIYGIKKNHVSDLTADRNDARVILEAETCSG